MNLGELFVKLGIQGGDKTLGTLQANQKAFKGTASMALEAKAAILGATYALQSLFASSNRAGSDLTNFNAMMGVSAQTLQRYQYAARQVGVSNASVEASFKGLQAAMTKTLMGEQAPKGLARVAQLTGDLSPDDIAEYSKNPEKLLQRLQEYSAKEQDAGFRNEVLRSFGLGDDMIAGLNRQAFRPEVLNKAPTYSDSEVASLDKAGVAWSNLGNKIEMAVGRFNAKHGNQIVGDISKIVEEVVKLAESFMKLAEKLDLFHWFGEAIRGWSLIFKELTGLIDYLIEKVPSLTSSIGNFFTEKIPSVMQSIAEEVDKNYRSAPTLKPMAPSIYDDRYKNKEMLADKAWGEWENKKRAERSFLPGREVGVAPSVQLLAAERNLLPRPVVPREANVPAAGPMAAAPPTQGQGTQNITVNQTMNFQDGAADPQKTKRIQTEAIQAAMRQIPAMARGN